jgi:hypothetical protein
VLRAWEQIGIDQLMIDVEHTSRPVTEVLDELGEYVMPRFRPG